MKMSDSSIVASLGSDSRSSSPEMFSLPNSSNYGTPLTGRTAPVMIPLKVLPKAAPKMITKTKTLRRCCGFALALSGCLFYFIRLILVTVLFGWRILLDSNEQLVFYKSFALEAFTYTIGIVLFLLVMIKPRLTLESPNNFKVIEN